MTDKIKEVQGQKLFECAECGEMVELMEKFKFEISEEQQEEEIETPGCMPEIDFFRYRWVFKPCKKCNTITTVVTEIDRY